MAKNIVVPHLGDSVIEATIIKWTKQQGDKVRLGETVVELETEKANFEVAAEATGILDSIAKQADEDVEVGDILGSIEVSANKEDTEEAPREPKPRPSRQPKKFRRKNSLKKNPRPV